MAEKPEKHHRTLPRLKIPSFRRNSSPDQTLQEENSEGDESSGTETLPHLLRIKVSAR